MDSGVHRDSCPRHAETDCWSGLAALSTQTSEATDDVEFIACTCLFQIPSRRVDTVLIAQALQIILEFTEHKSALRVGEPYVVRMLPGKDSPNAVALRRRNVPR